MPQPRIPHSRFETPNVPESDRATRFAAFNREIEARLSALDRGKYIDPSVAREQLAQKSRQR